MDRSIILDSNLSLISDNDVRENLPDVDIQKPDNVVSSLEETESPTVLIVSNRTWRDEYLDKLTSEDWVTTTGVGYDAIPIRALSEAEVAFTNSAGINSAQIAEHVFATAFSFTRKLWIYRDQQRSQEWKKHRVEMTDLMNDTCCILGLGDIGEAVSERASAFGMTIHGVKRSIDNYDGSADRVYRSEDLYDALRGARLFVIAVPLTAETRGMISYRDLKALAPDSIIVNVARGPVLDTDAVIAALDDGEISAACLDVTDPEPLPAGHPLWDRDDVLITPHCAGASDKYSERFVSHFIDQFHRWCSGQGLHHRVV